MAVIAQIIDNAPPNTIDYLIYPDQAVSTQQYILTQLNNYQNLFHETEQTYIQRARQLYDSIHNSDIARQARAAIRSVKGALRPDVICELTDLEDVRSAQPRMARYIMAQPDIRQLYHQQRCDGYHDVYVDHYPNDIKHSHYDYQLVMSGIVQDIKDENGEDSWMVTTYATDIIEGDKALDFYEKVDILHTWEIIELAIKSGQDPTDRYEGRL